VAGHFFKTACVVIRPELAWLLDLFPWVVRFHAGFLGLWEMKSTDVLLFEQEHLFSLTTAKTVLPEVNAQDVGT